ncbi:T9SS type B sorting domain-containing protein [Flagellimonas myxillae]|uniref:T9SS type B sorting domain-containing protein n=1 Tax=Flagellimonas myxillae TaxID=2942214 RepID=UPI00201EF7B3|nr:T9SS type B sorting domain-containing protein [Muricauda myxillae]MCL6265410.1 T9SS type B sorting domain-containing protein [Muricauda myxillae]
MKRALTLLMACWFGMACAQDREAGIWHFGQYAGLDFNSLVPQSLVGSDMDTYEGSATISTEEGRLLFYTDSEIAYNRLHRRMPGSRALSGSNFSTQSSIIVPKPGFPNFYYLFITDDYETVDTIVWNGDGLNFFEVNMTGPGTISSRGAHLITYDPDNRFERALKCSQKLTAIKDPCEEIYWVVAHFNDSFYAFKVDENGVDENPVVSQVGPSIHLGAYSGNAKGQIKMSPDGTKLAMANFMNNVDPSGHSPGSLYLFDFDILTGAISNAQQLMDDDFVFAYGVEFSPDSKMLYATVSSYNNGDVPPSGHDNDGSILVQIDLENNNRYQKIAESLVDPTALQLAIDGKIYQAHVQRRHLGVINNPKELGAACNYVEDGLPMSRSSHKGLPSFVQSYFQVRVEYEEACVDDSTKLSTNYLPDPDNIAWDFGDGSPVLNTVDKSPEHVYNRPGTYIVTATITKGAEVETYTKEVEVTALPFANAAELVQCDLDGDGFSNFNLFESASLINAAEGLTFSFHDSERGARGGSSPIPNPESYSNASGSQLYVRVENELGCFDITTLDLRVVSTAIPSNFNLEVRACDDGIDNNYADGIGTFEFSDATNSILALFPSNSNFTVGFYASESDALSELNPIDPSRYRNASSPGQQRIWVRVDGADQNACVGLGEHITLAVDEGPLFDLEPTLEICQNQLPYSIGARNPQGNYAYEWTDAEGNVVGTGQNFDIPGAGIFTVNAMQTDGTGCEAFKTIEVTTIDPPEIVDVQVDGLISSQSTATVQLVENGNFEFSLDDPLGPFQPGNIFQNVTPGIHKAYARDANGCEVVEFQFSVIGHPAFFTPNNDNVNDFWQIQGISGDIQSQSIVYIFDRYGNVLAQVDPASPGWDGSWNGQPLPASDYWFSVSLEDGRSFKGHFTLKR